MVVGSFLKEMSANEKAAPLSRYSRSVDVDDVAVDDELVAVSLHLAVVLAVGRIVLEQVSLESASDKPQEVHGSAYHVLGVEEGVVDGDNLDGALLQGCAEHEASDAAKAAGNVVKQSLKLRVRCSYH